MFEKNIEETLKNEALKNNLWKAVNHTLSSRKKVLKNYPNWELLRENAENIRKFSIDNLDYLWEEAKNKIIRRGGNFYFAEDN